MKTRNLFFISMLTGLLLPGMIACTRPAEQKSKTGLEEISIAELQEGYKAGKFTVVEITQGYLDRIEEIDKNGPALKSVIQVNPDVLEIAARLDEELKQGKSRGPMHGIPVLLKDNIDTRDKMPTTAGSLMLKNSFPLKDSWVAARLREAGAVILGKTNLSEWANFHSSYSSSGWSALGGQTKNPYDLTRNPCGSSSGSGVAVSANLTVLAIGTETDGSIVCPANNNGIVGIKPTVGLISRTGIIPISFTQDTPGPMARTVTDAAICLGAMTGIDTTDSKTLQSEGKSLSDYTPYLKTNGLKGKRIGVDKTLTGHNFHIDKVMQQAVEFLKNSGAEVIEIRNVLKPEVENMEFEILLYEFKDGLNKYFASLGAKAPVKSMEELIRLQAADSTEMEWFDHTLFEMAQKKGAVGSDEYKKLLNDMLKGARDNGIDKIMNENKLDAIVAPTGSPAWKTDLVNGDNFGISSSSAAAIAGYPAISLPMGFVAGLPVNITFYGRAWSEPTLIGMAYAYEQGTKHRKQPTFKTGEHDGGDDK